MAALPPGDMPQMAPEGLTAMWHAWSAASSSLAVGSTTNASSACTRHQHFQFGKGQHCLDSQSDEKQTINQGSKMRAGSFMFFHT